MMLLLLNMGLVTTHTWCCRYNLRHQGSGKFPTENYRAPSSSPPIMAFDEAAVRNAGFYRCDLCQAHQKPSEYGLMHLDVSIHCPHFTEARLFLSCRASGRYCSSPHLLSAMSAQAIMWM